MTATTPPSSLRVRTLNDLPPNPLGRFVLYWMIGARRTSWNFGLDRARAWALHLGRPLLVLEALRCDYQWASDRLHRFVLDGMHDNQTACARHGVSYYPYVEPTPGAGRGLLAALAAHAAVVVTDRTPIFDLAALVAASTRVVPTAFEAVDANGLLPLDHPGEGQVFPSAYVFRRYLQKALPGCLDERPLADPLSALSALGPAEVPGAVTTRWPSAGPTLLTHGATLASLPIDHTVPPVGEPGGAVAAGGRLADFITHKLARYAERSHPDEDVATGLSPHLHFGHISAHEIAHTVLSHEGWTPSRLGTSTAGKKEGWWGLSAAAEAFLDELVTWRELAYNMADRRDDSARYESLPTWAQATLDTHAADQREYHYTLDQFARSATHDDLWNAAQRQLRTEGRLHNYLRMLWGKKILEWSPSPREALATMVELNNRYALDGRDPNSYAGIFWVLGRYDRPWAPQRPIFGTIRYMSSANTARKLRLKHYLARYSPSLF